MKESQYSKVFNKIKKAKETEGCNYSEKPKESKGKKLLTNLLSIITQTIIGKIVTVAFTAIVGIVGAGVVTHNSMVKRNIQNSRTISTTYSSVSTRGYREKSDSSAHSESHLSSSSQTKKAYSRKSENDSSSNENNSSINSNSSSSSIENDSSSKATSSSYPEISSATTSS